MRGPQPPAGAQHNRQLHLQRDPVRFGPHGHLFPQVVRVDDHPFVAVRSDVRQREVQHGNPAHGQQRLGPRKGQGTKAGSKPGGKQKGGVHGGSVTRATGASRPITLAFHSPDLPPARDPSMNTIPALFLHRVTESPDRISAWAPTPDPDDQFFLEPAPHDPTAPEGWTAATHAQTHRLVAGLAKRLQSLGVGRGVPVTILAQTSERWTLADMAVQCLGASRWGCTPP